MAVKRVRKTDVKRFATLYVNGPQGIAGNWVSCENIIGVKMPQNWPGLAEALTKEGGSLPDLGPAIGLGTIATKVKEPKSKDEWLKLANELQPIIDSVARGETKATAAQTALIRHVLDRAYGRVSTTADDKKPAAAVLILPTISTGKETHICPVCGHNATPKEPDGNNLPA